MNYFAYHQNFWNKRLSFRIAEKCEEWGPLFRPTALPDLYNWKLEWVLFFKDNTYARTAEYFEKRARVADSHRTSFSFHYGPVTARDVSGRPKYFSKDPVVLRLDNDSGREHLHYKIPGKHYYQNEVEGLIILNVDVFRFMQAVLLHRSSGSEMADILGFTL